MGLSFISEGSSDLGAPFHYERSAVLAASPEQVFAYLDDQRNLAGHMSRPTWKMGGGSMRVTVDEANGKAIGSRIDIDGRAFGIKLSLTEVVTERRSPDRKVWRTFGVTNLLVIDSYSMGFELKRRGDGCQVRIFIDYSLPERGIDQLLGRLLGRYYAKWCVNTMVQDAAKVFADGLN